MKKLLTFLVAGILYSLPCFALFSTMDTADLLPEDHYSLGLEPQFIMNRYSGANVIAHLDVGANDSSNLKFVLGSGSTTFQAGGFYKLVPIPDIHDQPGIGFFAGVIYASYNGNSALHLRLHPLISKQFKTDASGLITPYVSIPVGVSFLSGTTTYPVQIALGGRWLPPGVKHMNFLLETGFEVNAAFSYISAMVSVPFDDWGSIRFD